MIMMTISQTAVLGSRDDHQALGPQSNRYYKSTLCAAVSAATKPNAMEVLLQSFRGCQARNAVPAQCAA